MDRYCAEPAKGRLRARMALLAILLMGGANSCSLPTPPANFDPVFPQHFSVPSWSARNVIAYVDFGVTCIRSDGAYLVDTSKAGVWLCDVAAGSRSRFLSLGDCPAWDPTGELLTVTRGAELRTYGRDGHLRWVMPTTGLAVGPSWSFDGQYVAWDQTLEDSGIWVAHRDTLVPRRLVPIPGHASWNPLKLSILNIVSGGPHGGAPTVFREMDLTTGVMDTLFIFDGIVVHPRYSPDGSRIVCARFEGGGLLLVTPSGGVLPVQPTLRNKDPAWGPDDDFWMEPAWSPDGANLCYVRYNSRSRWPWRNSLWRYDLITGDEVLLVPPWPNPCGGSTGR